MAFLTARKFIGAKIEDTRYTAETLAETDYDVPAYNISYSSTIDQYERAVNLDNFSKLTNIPGKQMAEVSFSVDVAPGNATDMSVVPSWGKCLRACGFKQNSMAAGVSWVSDSTVCDTLTIDIADTEECSSPSQRVIRLSGCHGTVVTAVDQVGNPTRYDFTFTGQINSVFDRASAFTSINVLATTPDSVLSATVEAGGYTDIDCNTINIDIGNDIQMEIDPSDATGYKGAHIVNRNITAQIDPYMHTVAERDWYTQNLNVDSNLNSFTFATENFVYYLKQLQVVNSLQDGDRNGLVTETVNFKSVAAPDDDEFYILQGISG